MSTSDISSVTNLLAEAKVDKINEVSFKGQSLKLDEAKDALPIVNAIEEAKDVQSLRLEGNTLGVEAAEAIAKALEKRPEFQRARWSDMFTGRLRSEIPPALRSLGGAIIKSSARLVELDLSDNAFGPDGVKAFKELLTSTACYSLQELRLNNNGLGIGGKILAEALIECHKLSTQAGKPLELKVFICGRNRLENPCAIALAKAFKTLKSLEEIAMFQNGINHEGITALAESLAYNKNLKVINLNDNTFTAKGAISMAKSIKHLDKLEVINFGDCLVKSEGAEALADTLKNGVPALKELYLAFGEINSLAAVKIVESLYGKAMEKLDLNGNCLGEDGIEEVKGTLEAADQLDILGSLSDDEGDDEEDDDDDEYEDVDEDEEDEEGTTIKDPALEVKGTAIIPKKENTQVSYTVEEFLTFPTADKLLGIGNDRADKFSNHLKDKQSDVESVIKVFMNVAIVMDSKRPKVIEAIHECTDAILGQFLKDNDTKMDVVLNTILVHMGLIKSEDKIKPIADLSGILITLAYVCKQEYFPVKLKNILTVFIAKPHPALNRCVEARDQLLSALYT
ncbi:ran GTPase-activating protein 1-like [Antedon mediterranea]|uniref:ran GTPase-activating protein 1-like n=1 Tax=Antedon mediterranea TaxID=105859 RepID=UPI003AF7934E